MPTFSNLPLPRRYNSLRLLGFDYSSPTASYFTTLSTDSSRPVFGDINLAKSVLAALLNQNHLRVSAYSLLPDHFHLLVSVLRNWPRVRPEHFLSKQLWHRSFNDHVIRNDIDLRETLEYIVMNPVRRGYVTKPQFYPFTGVM